MLCVLLAAQYSIAQNKNSYTLDDTLQARQYLDVAKTFETSAKYDSSIFYYSKARTIYLELCEQHYEIILFRNAAFCSNKIGWNLMLQDKHQQSLNILEDNLVFVLQKFGENDQETAQCYNNIATTNWRLGYYDKALSSYEKAFAIVKSLNGEENIKTANVLLNIGNVYADKGYYDKSIDIQLKALSIQIKNLGEEHQNIASSLNNLGLTYRQLGDYDKALEYMNRGLALRLRLLKVNHPLISSSYNNIGNVLFQIKKYDDAIEMHKKALEIRLINFGEDNQQVAGSYNNIGNSLFRKENYDSAMTMYQKSLSIRKKVLKESHPDFAYSYMNIGSVYSVKKDFANSLKYHNMALALRKVKLGEKHPLTAGDYLNIAEVYFKKEEYDSSLYFCQKSIVSLVSGFDDTTAFNNPELKGISSKEKLFEALSLKAELYFVLSKGSDLNKIMASLNTYILAAELVDQMRTGYMAEGSRLILSESAGFLLEKAINISLNAYKLTGKNEHKEKAFYFIEKSKSAVLQTALNESKAKTFANIPEEKLEKEKELKAQLSFYETELLNEQNKKQNFDSLKIYDYQQKLFSYNYQYEELIKELESEYPSYFYLKYQVRPKTISEIQSALENNASMLEYFVGDSSVYIAVISKDNHEVIAVNKPKDFESLIKEFYSSIIKSETSKYISSANQLAELLIEPVASKIKSKAKLVVIPHDALFKVPFEALFTKPQNRKEKDFRRFNYLIKDFDISYHYSASLFVESQKQNSSNPSKNFIGFAPVFPKENISGYTISTVKTFLLASNDDVVRSVSIDGKNYDELKYSEWEVNSIIDLFNKNKTSSINTAYFYANAKEDSFKTNVKDYSIVHIASHSFMNEDQPDISGVIFAQPTDSVLSNDGILYSGETYNLELSADLVVLSSCESGLGKLFRGEGMMALNRGFLYSGASNIVFSLWKIPDKHTSELMVEFYKQMISGKTYSESLRKAKLKMINNEITARPRSWGGFLLIGSD